MAEDDLYSQAVSDYVMGARAQTAAGLDTTPDDAARAYQLEQTTQVPSQVIAPDLDQFEAATKRAMATRLVSQNPKLMAYVHSHPMAAGISSDDWGALDKFSRGAQVTASALETLGNFANPYIPEKIKETAQDIHTIYTNPQLLTRLPKAVAQIGLGIANDIKTLIGPIYGEGQVGSPEFAQASSELAMFGIRGAPGGRAGLTWMGAGREPPRGISPEIDQAKAQLNAEALEQIDADLAEAQGSATKERAPDMFQRFAEQHYGSATIGIHPDAALSLYGDKAPAFDDGLLGWVPGITDKLEAAKLTGADVEVPISDWISKVDPALAKQLHDDLRVWPGGITAREATELTPPPEIVDSPLAHVRAAAGLEPMFSMGDRKLSLERNDESPGLFGVDEESGMHGYDLLDENGVAVGGMIISPQGKHLVVENIEGLAGRWANAFGPSLMRDLLRQLKSLYPDAETIGGYRVTGARPMPADTIVRLDTPELISKLNDYENFSRILSNGYRPIDAGVEANIQPSAAFTAHEKELAGAVHDEITRITGGKAKAQPTAGISYQGTKPRGIFFPRSSLILYDLLDKDPVGVGRHEAIHFLRDQGLFTSKEWGALHDAAMQEDWFSRYGIHERYGALNLTHDQMLEESVAEAFREWAQTAEESRRSYSPVAQIFQKLWDFLQRLKGRFAEIFGHVPTADELFSRVSSGEVGERAAQGSAGGRPMFSTEDLDNLRAESVGLDLKSFQRIQKLVQERYRQDVEASLKAAEREQAKRQTKEWKDNKAQMAQEVEATIRQRPDVAADLFIGNGEFFGEKLRQRFTLRADDLTPEQKAGLPAHYVSKNGLPIDEVGRQFGYQSGDAMVEQLAAYNALKGDRSPQQMLQHVIDTETDRMMEAKYGNLGQNILTEAQDQALSDNQLNLLIEEYHAAALQAGVTAVDKNTVMDKAREIVDQMPLSSVNFEKQMALIGGHYRAAVRDLIGGNPASAVVNLEKRTLAGFVAAEVKKVQADKVKFDALAKRYAKAWDPTKPQTIAPDFNLFTRDILSRVGLRYGMSVSGLAERISRSAFRDLTDFITKTEDEGKTYGLELPVPDWVLNPGPKPAIYPEMSVAQFRDLRTAVTVMDKIGRADQKVIRAGEAQNLKDLVSAAVSQLEKKFPAIPSERKPGIVNYAAAAFTNNETLMSRFDGRDPHGLFTETITYPMAERQNYQNTLQREVAAQYRELGPIKDATKALDSPLIDPITKRPRPITRSNLAVIISNMGNNYNWKVFCKGWGIDPDLMWKWVESVSTPEDLARAQQLGKIFNGLWEKSQTVYEHLYGVAPESVVPRPFTMHGQEWEGWYHPIVGDANLSRYVNKLPEPKEAETQFWPSTFNAYTKRRTGAVQVVSLDYDGALLRMDQMVHDIAMREVVANTAKIFRNNTFRQGVTGYYGREYMQSMDTWLNKVAGRNAFSSAAVAEATRLSNVLRSNVISTMIAFGVGTVEKHGLTAFAMSAREMGPNILKTIPQLTKLTAEVQLSRFAKANGELYGRGIYLGDRIYDFIKNSSEEIQRRERDTLNTLYGVQRQFDAKSTMRQQIATWGSKAVAWSDMISATSLWWGKYQDEIAANGGIHGDAVRVADLAVRRAHGSTAVTNLPQIAAGTGPLSQWFTSLYGFMGTSMQRRIEMLHDINDVYNLGRQGQIREAAKGIPAILSSAAVYFVWTGIVEEMVARQFTQDHRGPGEKAASFLFSTVAQTIIGLRDVVYDLEHGQENAGLFGTPIQHLQHLKRDAMKDRPLSKEHAGQFIQDACSTLGDLAGLCPTPIGRMAHYGLDVFDGFQHPRTPTDIYRGLASGKQQLRVVK